MSLFSLLGLSFANIYPYLIAVVAVALVVVLVVALSKKKAKQAKAKQAKHTQPTQPKQVAVPFKPEIIVAPATQRVVTGATPVKPQPAVDDTQDKGIIVVGEEEVLVRFNRSFESKLRQAPDELKGYYAELVNHALSYKKVKNKISWPHATISRTRDKIAIIVVRGKALYVYLAMDPEVAKQTIKGTIQDVSSKKRYQSVPTLFKVKSPLSLRKAKVLLDALMSAKDIQPGKPSIAVDAQNYPYDTTENLIKAGLVKVRAINGQEIDESKTLRAAGFNVVSSITAEQAHTMMADDVASALVQNSNSVGARTGKKYAVNIDTLSQKFEHGDVVTLQALKQKGIVPKKETAIKILARGTLDKALTIEADAFSLDAIKMIVLVGGTAIRK